MRLVIISGRSGSGKNTALHVLEDEGFYCIDNLPVTLLPSLVEKMTSGSDSPTKIAASIDVRNMPEALAEFPAVLASIKPLTISMEIIYLDAQDYTLIKRYSETRRKHPLSDHDIGLSEAIAMEHDLLEPVASRADLIIDTTNLNLYELRDRIRQRVSGSRDGNIALLFESFGFKRGIPLDADTVFDVRCLPNPYWHPELRKYNGKDEPVILYLKREAEVRQMLEDIKNFIDNWLPKYQQNNRTYFTVAIGCTGGKHRSVFLCEELHNYFQAKLSNVQVRHRELH